MPSLVMAGVSKRFASGHAALDHVDLAIANGEFLGIVGPSGSGKTTLLRVIAGLEPPDAGTLMIAKRDARDLKPQDRDAALVFQNQVPFPHLTGRENLAFGAKARHLPADELQDRIAEISGFLGLDALLPRMPSTMSGGEAQRLALGRALIRRPSLLLLDEPFSNLDAPLRVSLRGKLAEAHRRFAMTTVFATHDQEEAMALGDRVAVLHLGRLEQIGTARDLYDRPANPFVAGFLGNPPMMCIPVHVSFPDGCPVLHFADAIAMKVEPRACSELLRHRGAGPIVLGLRPEHVRLVPPSSDCTEPEISLIVLGLEDRGYDRIARVGRAGAEFLVRLPPGDIPRIDDEVRVGLDLNLASWFDPISGARHVMPPPEPTGADLPREANPIP